MSIKITGVHILDKLEFLRSETSTLASEFIATISYFKSDLAKNAKPPDLRALMDKYARTEVRIAKLQDIQSAFNLHVKVNVNDESIPLERAIKLYGVAGFSKNKWTDAAKPLERNMFVARLKDSENPVKSIASDEAKVLAKAATILAAKYKTAIRTGNAALVDLEVLVRKYQLDGIDESLFDDEQ